VTDEDLMLAVRAGDTSCLAPLFERHHRQLFDYLARMTGNPAAAEDLVQDVFIRILKYRHTFRGDSRFGTWAFRIARNVRADHFRSRQSRETPLDEAAEPATGVASTDETFEHDRQAARLRRALLLMREDQRELIVLARYRGMKYEAIADLLGVEVGTIKTRMHRAVGQLREIFLGLSENEPCSVKQPEKRLLMV
jgi:RNA polymerase sigma-70 factor (ECF subfamily)